MNKEKQLRFCFTVFSIRHHSAYCKRVRIPKDISRLWFAQTAEHIDKNQNKQETYQNNKTHEKQRTTNK